MNVHKNARLTWQGRGGGALGRDARDHGRCL